MAELPEEAQRIDEYTSALIPGLPIISYYNDNLNTIAFKVLDYNLLLQLDFVTFNDSINAYVHDNQFRDSSEYNYVMEELRSTLLDAFISLVTSDEDIISVPQIACCYGFRNIIQQFIQQRKDSKLPIVEYSIKSGLQMFYNVYKDKEKLKYSNHLDILLKANARIQNTDSWEKCLEILLKTNIQLKEETYRFFWLDPLKSPSTGDFVSRSKYNNIRYIIDNLSELSESKIKKRSLLLLKKSIKIILGT